jgi:hypothetical protein
MVRVDQVSMARDGNGDPVVQHDHVGSVVPDFGACKKNPRLSSLTPAWNLWMQECACACLGRFGRRPGHCGDGKAAKDAGD